LQECLNENIPINDIDVSINTDEPVQMIIDRWLLIVPPTYTLKHESFLSQYDPNFINPIFTLTDTTGSDFSLDIFVNEDDIKYTEQIGDFHVERLDLMITKLYNELESRKSDIDYFINNPDDIGDFDLQEYIEKYKRMHDRLILLNKCFKKRRENIPL